MSMISICNYRAHGYLTNKIGLSIHTLTEFYFSRFANKSIYGLASHLEYLGFKESYEQEAQLK